MWLSLLLLVSVGGIVAMDDRLMAKSAYYENDRCTTIAVGAAASTEGPMVTHTADCADCDFRLGKVPAARHEKGAKRTLYQYKGSYPATVAKDRGTTWHPRNLQGTPDQLRAWGEESIVTGRIPQVEHTYALYEAGYGIMNEFQVGIGESTCASVFWAAPTSAGGKAQIEARELSKIALERTKTVRDAILLMGELAEKYGFYSADWSGGDFSKGEGGEALTVVDKEEAWVFHVIPDDTGASAVWVAQRVPSDHVAVVANQFVIREITPNSPDFLYSANIWKVAERNNLWQNQGNNKLDFLKTYAPKRAHAPYSTRRVWRVFNLVAPSLVLNPFTDSYASEYPFSVKAERKLSPQDLMEIQSDHYEGTQFDLTKGLAAGPYGDPTRFDISPVDNLTFFDVLQGSFERAIAMFRTSYSIVAVSRPNVPDELALLWFSQYSPASSSYAPFYVGANDVPTPYRTGSLFQYDSSVSFWNFLAVGNYAARFYKDAMKDVREVRASLMQKCVLTVAEVEERAMRMIALSSSSKRQLRTGDGLEAATVDGTALELYQEAVSKIDSFLTANNIDKSTFPSEENCELLGSTRGDSVNQATVKKLLDVLLSFATTANAYVVVKEWRELLPQIITRYHDGYHAQQLTAPVIKMQKLFYPKWWLDAVGYFTNPPNKGPDVILFSPNPQGTPSDAKVQAPTSTIQIVVVTAAISSVLTLLVTFLVLKGNQKVEKMARRMNGYTEIEM